MQIWRDYGGEQDAEEVKEMVQKLVALGDNDGVPASGDQLQATVDAMIAKMDDSGDGKVLRLCACRRVCFNRHVCFRVCVFVRAWIPVMNNCWPAPGLFHSALTWVRSLGPSCGTASSR